MSRVQTAPGRWRDDGPQAARAMSRPYSTVHAAPVGQMHPILTPGGNAYEYVASGAGAAYSVNLANRIVRPPKAKPLRGAKIIVRKPSERRRQRDNERKAAQRRDPVLGERLRARQREAQRRYYERHRGECLERTRAQYAARLDRPVRKGIGRQRIAACRRPARPSFGCSAHTPKASRRSWPWRRRGA